MNYFFSPLPALPEPLGEPLPEVPAGLAVTHPNEREKQGCFPESSFGELLDTLTTSDKDTCSMESFEEDSERGESMEDGRWNMTQHEDFLQSLYFSLEEKSIHHNQDASYHGVVEEPKAYISEISTNHLAHAPHNAARFCGEGQHLGVETWLQKTAPHMQGHVLQRSQNKILGCETQGLCTDGKWIQTFHEDSGLKLAVPAQVMQHEEKKAKAPNPPPSSLVLQPQEQERKDVKNIKKKRSPSTKVGKKRVGRDLARINDKKAKRIMANRLSAQKSRMKKMQYVKDLHTNVATLRKDVRTLELQLKLSKMQKKRLEEINRMLKDEMKKRICVRFERKDQI